LRRAGYHSLTVDLPNIGGSGPPCGYFDRDLADAGAHLARLAPSLPLHFWGVSSGGYWAHLWLAREARFTAAFFEDVSPHLLEWAWRVAPWGRPAYLVFRSLFRRGYRFLDARAHAPGLGVRAAYVGGDSDRGIPTAATRSLAELSGSPFHLVPGAGHLESIKLARSAVTGLALETFARAEAAGGGCSPR
jgi:pimeloyl-ACP methyl ester carboxylesterase